MQTHEAAASDFGGTQRILQELAAIGFANPSAWVGPDGLVEPSAMQSSDCAAVASIETTKNGIKLKFYDKLKALELLGKHFGIFDGSGQTGEAQNNLLDLLWQPDQEEHALQQLQYPAEAGHDLVAGTGNDAV